MLCPRVHNFPTPKVVTITKQGADLDAVKTIVDLNYYYRSLVLTFPDEIKIPSPIEDMVVVDTEYYTVSDCPLSIFLEQSFIDNFVKKGKLYCLSSGKDCLVDNCACITPDGFLILHILDFIYQLLGIEGKKQPLNYYEIRIDLKTIVKKERIIKALNKLETFNFGIHWEPPSDEICPSSIAKYLSLKNLSVKTHQQAFERLTPDIRETPSIKDVDLKGMTEWIGMLALHGDLEPENSFISTYSQPESECPIKSTRIALIIVRGFLTPSLLTRLCKKIEEYVGTRDMENYWASASFQSFENGLYRWNNSTPSRFFAHDSSTTAFFTNEKHSVYTIGQIKFK